jgi:L,D-transpeptidase YbiS
MTTSSPIAERQAAARRAAAAREARGGHGVGFVLFTVFAAAVAVAAVGTGYSYRGDAGGGDVSPVLDVPSDPKSLQKLEARLQQRHRQLTSQLARQSPRGVYIVIDQTQNQLFLRKDDGLLREAVCSAGSGMVLKNPKGGVWVFDTPRGVFRVLSRMENPVWKKPDWAFVEEGKPIPKDPSERIEPGSLGEYALYFGNGYMIHGTLYERFLRRSVSHGCIRVGRDDLREVWSATGIGTPIYIY